MARAVLFDAPGPPGPAGPRGPAGPPGAAGSRAFIATTTDAVVAGQAVIPTNGKVRLAKSSVLGDVLVHGGIATQTGSADQEIEIITQGLVDPSVKNLGAGVACAVGTDASGNPVRVTDPTCVSGLKYVGTCDANGAIYVSPRTETEAVITDFGAVGDDSKDCTVAIQAALDSGAGIVRVPNGTFKVTDTLFIRKNSLHLVGTNSSESLLDFVGTFAAGILIEHTGSNNVDQTHITELSLDGNDTVMDLIVVHASFVTIEHNYIQYPKRFGVLVESGNASGAWGLTNLAGSYDIISDRPLVERNTGYSDGYNRAWTTIEDYTQPSVFGDVSVTVGDTSGMVAGMVCATIATASVGAGTPANIYQIKSVDSGTTLTLTWLGNTNAPQQATDSVTSASLQLGGFVVLHGSDSQAGRIAGNFSYNSVVDFCEASLGGNTWSSNYSEGRTVLGYFLGDSASASVWVCCNGEPITLLAAPLGYSGVIVGGDLSRNLSLIPAAQSYAMSIFGHESQLAAKQTGVDGASYFALIPGCNGLSTGNSAFDFGRISGGVTTGFSTAYNRSSAYWFGQASWFFWHHTGLNVDGDPNAGVLGFSENGQVDFGAPALLIGAAQGNTQRHWTYKQTGLSLVAGQNTIYLNGGVGTDSGAAVFADTGTTYWPSSLPNVRCHLEFDTVAHMVSAGVCEVDGVVIISKGGATNNLAAGVHVGSNCTATLVWEFDLYIPATRDGR